jgi:FkbM family methyltransferase
LFAKAKKGIVLLQSDPRLLLRRVLTEARSLFWSPRQSIRKNIGGASFEFDFTFDPSIKLMYEGIYEVDIVNTMKEYLRAGDTFIDVGANIGYLSAVAMGLVGPGGQVHSFEPVPEYCSRLRRLIPLNPGHRISINQSAAGESNASASIDVTGLPNIGWNTLVPGMMRRETVRQSIEVPVLRLDEYIRGSGLDRVAMIKIDTEGYEFPVLKGLSRYLQDPDHRPVFVVEIAPSAYPLLGVSLHELSAYMGEFGYRVFDIHHRARHVDLTSLHETTNVLIRAGQ